MPDDIVKNEWLWIIPEEFVNVEEQEEEESAVKRSKRKKEARAYGRGVWR